MALIVVAAAAALPGSVGSQGPSPAESITPGLFQGVEPAFDGTAVTTPTLDPAHRSEGALDDATAFLDPEDRPAVSGRPDARRIQPAAPIAVVAVPKPTPRSAPLLRSGRGWHHDPEVSWYGPGFYGKRTACGLALTKTLIGVANRTLPCGTTVVFRNPKNGRVVTAKVVDRGPYVSGRQWDLTGGLCVALDHCFTGPMDWRYG
jgi:hypothetical protein